jgi:hypothetical protein
MASGVAGDGLLEAVNRWWSSPVGQGRSVDAQGVYDLFDPRGSFLGSVTRPDRSEMLYASGAHVWVRWRGPFDEHYVVCYSMRSRQGERPFSP